MNVRGRAKRPAPFGELFAEVFGTEALFEFGPTEDDSNVVVDAVANVVAHPSGDKHRNDVHILDGFWKFCNAAMTDFCHVLRRICLDMHFHRRALVDKACREPSAVFAQAAVASFRCITKGS